MSRFYLVQTPLIWEEPASNRASIGDKLQDCHDGVVILPEMFTTGFSMISKKLAEPVNGETIEWAKGITADQNISLCGSLITEDGGRYFNRFVWVAPDGGTQYYDKRHLFRMAGEDEHYSAGSSRLITQAGDCRVMPQICYDLRFPVWSRNHGDYDVLVYVANWPAARRQHWLTLLQARAIENLCYVIGVNRIGTDGNGVNYSGDSCVVSPQGEFLLNLTGEDSIGTVDIDLDSLAAYRENFPAYRDADHYDINI